MGNPTCLSGSARSTRRPARWRPLTLALAAVLLLGAHQAAQAATFTVTKTADTNDGACNADCSLREAIVAANANGTGVDTIVFTNLGTSPDLYTLTIAGINEDASATGDLDILGNVTIQGNNASETIIQAGPTAGSGIDRVFEVRGAFSATFNSVTIRHGFVQTASGTGGGIGTFPSGIGSSITVTNSTITNNDTLVALGYGAGIMSWLNTLTVTNSTISNNYSGDFGGGIYCACALNMTGTVVSGNVSTLATSGGGGGIFLFTGTATIDNTTITNNRTNNPGAHGGGIWADSSTLSITNSNVTGNQAAGDGGGIYNSTAATTNVSLSRFTGNSAADGTGIFNAVGTVTAEDNWWGCDNFPDALAAVGCDTTSGVVDSDPRIDLRLIPAPPAVAFNSTSVLTADLTRNTAGALLSPAPSVFDGLTVTFDGGAFGSVTPTTATMTSGLATTTFTAGTAEGSSVASATLDNGSQTANVDVWRIPTVTISGVSAPENSGGAAFTFVITREHNLTNLSVSYQTADGTAIAGLGDYVSRPLTPAPFAIGGPLTQNVVVTVNPDPVVEANETFFVNLSNAVNANITVPQATGTILNDDSATLTVNDRTFSEGNAGAFPTATFTVTLSAAVQGGVTVSYATQDGTALAADSDYSAVAATALNFTGTAGETRTFNVTVTGDDKVELNETFAVNLSNPQHGGATGAVTIADAQGLGTITNDDQARLSISDRLQNELNSGSSAFGFTVTLDQQVDSIVTVDFQTQDSTATAADGDYATSSSSVTFPAGSPAGTTRNISVTVTGDTKVETNENFSVVLNNIQAAGRFVTFAKQVGIGTITNDDATTLSINDVTRAESADGATTAFAFAVTVVHAVQGGFSVDFATANGTALVADNDYLQRTTTVLPFAGNAGETQTITVTVNNDAKVEADETFFVNLTNIQARGLPVTLSDNQGLGTIQNDDVASLSINDRALNEGSGGVNTTYQFTVTLSAQVDTGVTVTFGTANGSATASDGDYVANTGTLTFTGTAGETKSINVTVNGDNKVELSEVFYVDLSNIQASGRNVAFADSRGEGTIQNDDRAQIVISNVLANEGTGGTTNFDFNAVLLDAVDAPVTVTFATQDGTALVGDNDYATATGQVTFSGVKDETKKITVLVTGDTKVELNQFFVVRLSNLQSNGRLVEFADDVGQGEIIDDDGAALSINDVSRNEGAGGSSTTYTFSVALSAGVDGPVTASFATANGTATTADSDYTSASGGLAFTGAAGETRTISVVVSNDAFAEKNETFFVNLTNVQAGPYSVVLGDGQGLGTIVNDDSMNLAITKDDRGVTAAPNDKILYDLAYRNLGSATARQVRVIEVVPANTTFDFASSAAGFSCSPNANAGSTCTLNVGTMSSGASGSAVFAVIVDDDLPGGVTQTSNTARVTDDSEDGADVSLANNSDTVTTTLKAAGADFYTLPPCRVIDTRKSPGPTGLGGPALIANSDRIFQVSGTCGIPVTATAIAVNVTVTQPTATGNVRVHPSGAAIPTASTINYTVGLTRANNAVVGLNGGQIAVFAAQATGTTVHFILDVTGYFK